MEVDRTVVAAEVGLVAEEVDGTATATAHNELAAATRDAMREKQHGKENSG